MANRSGLLPGEGAADDGADLQEGPGRPQYGKNAAPAWSKKQVNKIPSILSVVPRGADPRGRGEPAAAVPVL